MNGLGEVVKIERESPEWCGGYGVHLGCLGVMFAVSLYVEPRYCVAQTVYEGVLWKDFVGEFVAVMKCAYSVSVFTVWSEESVGDIWCKQRVSIASESENTVDITTTTTTTFKEGDKIKENKGDEREEETEENERKEEKTTENKEMKENTTENKKGNERGEKEDEMELVMERIGGKRVFEDRHPVPGISANACTQQRGIVGFWHNRLPHFRLDNTPSVGEEIQSKHRV